MRRPRRALGRLLQTHGLFLLALLLCLASVVFLVLALDLQTSVVSSLVRRPLYERVPPGFVPQDSYRSSAFVYLVGGSRLPELLVSLECLFARFNDHFRYPVLLFFDDKSFMARARNLLLDPATMREAGPLAGNLTAAQRALIELHHVRLEIPPTFTYTRTTPIVWSERPGWGYQHMISFWLKHIFNHTRIQSLSYFARLDTDSCLRSDVRYDLFERMRSHRALYAYRVLNLEQRHYIYGLGQFLQDWFESRRMYHCEVLWRPYLDDSMRPFQFYNNFEIVHVPTFATHPGIRDLVESVWQTNGIYQFRWGDAPLRYVEAKAFLQPDQILPLCDFDYQHGTIVYGAPRCDFSQLEDNE